MGGVEDIIPRLDSQDLKTLESIAARAIVESVKKERETQRERVRSIRTRYLNSIREERSRLRNFEDWLKTVAGEEL